MCPVIYRIPGSKRWVSSLPRPNEKKQRLKKVLKKFKSKDIKINESLKKKRYKKTKQYKKRKIKKTSFKKGSFGSSIFREMF